MEQSTNNLEKLKNETIYGNDGSPSLCRAAKMNMILAGDGQTNIRNKKNSLDTLENSENKGKHDVVITNMPFGLGSYETEKSSPCFNHESSLQEHRKLPCCRTKPSLKCAQFASLKNELKNCRDCLKILTD